MDLDPEEVILAVTEAKDGPDQKVDSEVEEEDSSAEEDSREGSLTKAHYKEAQCIWQGQR